MSTLQVFFRVFWFAMGNRFVVKWKLLYCLLKQAKRQRDLSKASDQPFEQHIYHFLKEVPLCFVKNGQAYRGKEIGDCFDLFYIFIVCLWFFLVYYWLKIAN